MVAIEERVHPTPFRTRKLSSPSPMILHNVMWESRPLPKIVRDPLAAHSARGSFFMFFPCASARYERFLVLHVFCSSPADAGDFLLWALACCAPDRRETKNHPLCGWRQYVIHTKTPFRYDEVVQAHRNINGKVFLLWEPRLIA